MVECFPQPFGRYVLTRKIGEGGMAEVYQATVNVAEGLTKRVVIKKIRQEFAGLDEFTHMFVEEAKIALSLNHANIVQVFDFGRVHGSFYLAMELVEGIDLMKLFRILSDARQSMPAVIVAYIGHQVAAGLAYAHRKTDERGQLLGIVHRDVTPHNVMVGFEGHVKILDFGIARTRAEALRTASEDGSSRTIKGKVAYMSPEQASGRALDARSDLYSLGVVMHELLRGELVHRDQGATGALKAVRTIPLPPIREVAPHVPGQLAEIVDRALARDTSARYATARAMQADLAAFLHRADPVVDDEVLSRFVGTLARPAPVPYASTDQATRDLEGTSYPQRSQAAQRLMMVALSFYATADATAEGAASATVRGLLEDLAFKRDAVILRLDPSAAMLAFGAVLRTTEDPERTLRAAIALRDDLRESAPDLRVGIVLANVPAVVRRSPGERVEVDLAAAIEAKLIDFAAAQRGAPIFVSNNLVEALTRNYRFGLPQQIDTVAEDLQPSEFDAFVPLWGPRGSTRPPSTGPGGRNLLVGRELELKSLRDSFAEAIRVRRSRTIVIVGDPGVGKRALVERFIASLPTTACWVLRATGMASRRNVSLGVILHLLASFLAVEHSTSTAEIIRQLDAHGIKDSRELGEALASALGLVDGRSDLDPSTRRERLARLVRRLLASLAKRRPVLLVLEDVHLYDEVSLSLFSQWVETPQPWPVLAIATGRTFVPQLERWRDHRHVISLDLLELDPQARRSLIIQRFEDPETAQGLADAILAVTGGNPLFIEQVLGSLLDHNAIAWNAQGRRLRIQRLPPTIELPRSIEVVLTDRIDKLAAADREVLQAASILGRRFRTPELQALVGREISQNLATLTGRQLLERPDEGTSDYGGYRFTTVSLHEVCKASIDEQQARRWHQRAAKLLRQRPDFNYAHEAGAIADHLLAAGSHDEAIEPALHAAARACDVASNREAYHYLTHALRLLDPGDPRRWEALLQRESILQAWGRRRAQGADLRQLLQIAESSGSSEQKIVAMLRLLRFYLEVERYQQAERLVPRLRPWIEECDAKDPWPAAFGELRSDLAYATGHLHDAQTLAHEALDCCPPDLRGQRIRCRLLRNIGRVQISLNEISRARQAYDEALELARSIGNSRLQAELLNALGEVAGRSTRYQEAVDYFKAALAIDRDLGDRYATGRKLANLGTAYACIGSFHRAERMLRKALELHEAVERRAAFTDAVVQLGEVVAALGDLDGARALLLEAARAAASAGDLRTEMRARIRLAAALCELGTGTHDTQASAVIAGQVLSTARAHGLRTAQTRALHVLAKLALPDDRSRAIELSREAAELFRAGAAPLDGVLSLFLWGKLLHENGDRKGAALIAEAAERVRGRLEELRDPDLRRSYLALPDVQAILGHDAAQLPS